jgi:phenylpropionate dioxygenase-like ring-hydroxylating dioxygenase large terminal subunit
MLAVRQPGFSLPGEFYTDDEVFRLDLERVFHRQCLFVGYTCQLPRPDDSFTFEIGGDSLILMRDAGGDVHTSTPAGIVARGFAPSHSGIRSSRYQPGPYSSIAEPGVEQFVDWYLRHLRDERDNP